MKTVILINTKEYPYHEGVASDIKSCALTADAGIIDLSDYLALYEAYNEIVRYAPDLIINIDIAGYILKTEADNISLNGIPCRVVNVLFQKSDRYGNDLKRRQNLSTFTYFSKREINSVELFNQIKNKYQNIPNPCVMCEYDIKSNEGTINRDHISKWIPDMIKEVRL